MLGANLAVLMAPVAHAAEASPWDGDQRSAVRLIAAAQRGEGRATIHRAGVEIRLAPGWKTYWRYPGDSGVPPRFDLSHSSNVKSFTIRWPAPQRLTDEGGTSIGYKHNVVFPLEVVPQDPARVVTLVLKLDYAVCEKICIPAEATAELALTGKPGSHDGDLAAIEALVPAPAQVGNGGPLAISAVARDNSGARPRVIVDVMRPDGRPVDLFAEGPTPEWALPVPTPTQGAPAGQQRFVFDLDGLPPDTKPDGATLRLTAVSGETAIEAPYRLD